MKPSQTIIVGAALAGLLTGSVAARGAVATSAAKAGIVIEYKGATKAKKEKHACKGQNSCKGKGGCKTGNNGCKGKNSCKGLGGCATAGTMPPMK
jgi:hypothetical protein